MSIEQIAYEALNQLSVSINLRETERLRLNALGLPDPDAVRFENEADREAFEAKGQNFWKEVQFALTDRERDYPAGKIISEHIMPAVRVLADWLYQRETHSPLGPLPVCAMDGLAMAAVTDPVTGHSLRARRWHSAKAGKECLAFEICSANYQPQENLLGPFLTA